MNRISTVTRHTVARHTFALTAVATVAGLGMSGTLPGLAAAAGDPFVGMQVLDLLCESKGGTPVNSPYAISRCQEARAMEGVEIEQLVCDGLLDGTFTSAPTVGRPNRVNWACIPGAPL